MLLDLFEWLSNQNKVKNLESYLGVHSKFIFTQCEIYSMSPQNLKEMIDFIEDYLSFIDVKYKLNNDINKYKEHIFKKIIKNDGTNE